MKMTRMGSALLKWSATRFYSRIHHLTHRMPIEVRPITAKRVLVIAPHTDDEVIAAGGTLALHQQVKSDVLVGFVTSDVDTAAAGEPNCVEEARKVAELLGFECRFLGFSDGSLSWQERPVAERISELIREHRPDVIVCPFPADHHRDHQATAAATADAIRTADYSGEVWGYEVWQTLWPNIAVDVTSVIETKRKAINLYQSKVSGLHYADAAIGLNRYRGLRVERPYAEGFYACSGAEFQEIARQLFRV